MAFEPVGGTDPEPRRPQQYARDLATAVNELLRAPERRQAMGLEARRRVEAHFGWEAIARNTLNYYEELRAAWQGRRKLK